jgi:putative tryptophan/tyrosine transport system substrate-binding protein
MRRREFIAALAGATAWPLVARAQQSQKIPRIGVLWWGAPNDRGVTPFVELFRQAFREIGYIEGKTIKFEDRFSGERFERVDQLAVELVQSAVDVLVGSVTAAATAAKRATKTIPIVFVYVYDPVASKLVDSLAHPGGNATGLNTMLSDVGTKQVTLLSEISSHFSRLAILVNPNNGPSLRVVQEMKTAADRLSLTVDLFEAPTASDLDQTFPAIAQRSPDGLVISADPMFVSERERIAKLALENRLPTMSWIREITEAGALISYGPNVRDIYRRAAGYVDKILKGAKPSDLPVEQATKFELLINLKTAKALGLEIPPKLLSLADEVIE